MNVPMILWMKFRDENHSFRIWLPLILVYILLLPLVALGLIALPFLYLAKENPQARAVMRLLLYLPQLVRSMNGTEIDIHSDDSDITLSIR